MLILGIETSCDETSAAVVRGGREVLSNVVSSQIKLHEEFGGVVPELAARAHLDNVIPVVEAALRKADITTADLDGIAVTNGPGLVGPLLVGVSFAKGLAGALELPLVGIHHIEAHLYAPRMDHPDLPDPHIALVASGGHTNLILVEGVGEYKVLGRTVDDAAGECFDKVAQFLELGFPGGPAVQRVAEQTDAESYKLPRPMLHQPNLDFSFSGLKTAVMNLVREQQAAGLTLDKPRLAKSVQEAIVETLAGKAIRACADTGARALTISGGVAANGPLREMLERRGAEKGIYVALAPRSLCTDNGAMIAGLGYEKIRQGERAGDELDAQSRLPLPGGERVR